MITLTCRLTILDWLKPGSLKLRAIFRTRTCSAANSDGTCLCLNSDPFDRTTEVETKFHFSSLVQLVLTLTLVYHVFFINSFTPEFSFLSCGVSYVPTKCITLVTEKRKYFFKYATSYRRWFYFCFAYFVATSFASQQRHLLCSVWELEYFHANYLQESRIISMMKWLRGEKTYYINNMNNFSLSCYFSKYFFSTVWLCRFRAVILMSEWHLFTPCTPWHHHYNYIYDVIFYAIFVTMSRSFFSYFFSFAITWPFLCYGYVMVDREGSEVVHNL